jgi:hypothetical protein
MKDKSITLVCITSIHHELSSFAIKKTLECVPIDDIVIFSDKPLYIEKPHKHFQLNRKIDLGEYSYIILKELHKYIKTSHVLIVQYDGFATNKEFWDEDFLNYDFVGSISNNFHNHVQKMVKYFENDENQSLKEKFFSKPFWFTLGGGFSLRSKKLLEATDKCNIVPFVPDFLNDEPEQGKVFLPEDMLICFFHKEKLEKECDIKFAPVEVGMNFCSELYSAYEHSLGFHGWHNIPFFLTQEECLYYMQRLKTWKDEKEEMDARRPNLHTLLYHSVVQKYSDLYLFLENKYKLTDFWYNTSKIVSANNKLLKEKKDANTKT